MANYYISPTGNDTTGSGTSGSPWLTVSKAHTSASSGDTIYCQDGTFTWVSQTFTKTITIEAVNHGSVIFDAGGADVTWTENADIVLNFIGIHFTDNVVTGGECFITQTTSANYYTKFTNCFFYNLHAKSSIDNEGIFSGYYGKAYFFFVSCVIYDVSCVDNTAGGGWAGLVTGRATKSHFTNCVLYFNATGTNAFKAVQVGQVQAGEDITITTINTIIKNDGATFTALLIGTGVNKVMAPTYSCQHGNWTTNSCSSGTGNITGDPLFVDAANNDFRLRQSSPCIDAGTIV